MVFREDQNVHQSSILMDSFPLYKLKIQFYFLTLSAEERLKKKKEKNTKHFLQLKIFILKTDEKKTYSPNDFLGA